MKRHPSFTWLALAATLAMASLAWAQSPAPTTARPAAKPAVHAAPASAPAATPAAAAKPAPGKAPSHAELVDLNSASKEELMKLPGIGDAISDKIVAGRPWASKAQLLSKGVVNRAVYAKIKDRIVAKQAKSS